MFSEGSCAVGDCLGIVVRGGVGVGVGGKGCFDTGRFIIQMQRCREELGNRNINLLLFLKVKLYPTREILFMFTVPFRASFSNFGFFIVVFDPLTD